MENKDTKITIRITEGEVEEIDNFLKSTARFASRSEFIRFAALEYISQNRITILGPNEISLRLDKIMEQTLALAIRQGYFNDRSDAITEILNVARSSGLISKIIDSKNNEFRAVMDKSTGARVEDLSLRTKIDRSNDDEEKS
ncbi:MAG: ribbon-helix-helix domain-containing protein [Thermoplasmataceae archaeon]